MVIQLLFVSMFVQAALGAGTGCEDTDEKACQILAKSRTNLCSDACLSKYCQRTCGKCRAPTESYQTRCGIRCLGGVCIPCLTSRTRRQCSYTKMKVRLARQVMLTPPGPTSSLLGIRQCSVWCSMDTCCRLRWPGGEPYEVTAPHALKCFQCNEVDAPEMCKNQTLCPTQDHECIVTQALSSDFRPIFKLGCAQRQVCGQLFGTQAPPVMTTMPPQTTMDMTTGDMMTNMPTDMATDMVTDMMTDMPTDSPTTMDQMTTSFLIGKRQIQGSCCDSDLCNGPAPIVTNPTIITIGKRDVNSSACMDVDDEACKRLALAKTDICNDACFASACPVQCGKCAECYTCDSIEDPENCTQTEICPSGEECYTLEKLRSDGTHSFQLGCLHPDVCTKLHQGATNIFEGDKSVRSDPIELSLHGSCCQSSLCNHKKFTAQPLATKPPTAPPPTGACAYRGHCPANFHILDQHCFASSTDELSYNEAKEFCAKYCSSLAEFPSADPFHAIANYYNHHKRPTSGFLFSNAIPLARDFWVGATDHGSSSHKLVWESTGKSVYPLHQTSTHVRGRTHCGIMRVDSKTNDIMPEDCHHHHRALCIANWK